MQIQKLKLGQQNNDKGSFNLAGANEKATLKCKKIIIKTLAKLYQSVYCHSMVKNITPKFHSKTPSKFHSTPRLHSINYAMPILFNFLNTRSMIPVYKYLIHLFSCIYDGHANNKGAE